MQRESMGVDVASTISKVKDYFAEQSAISAFNQSLMTHLSDVLKRHMAQLMSPENTQRLRHGGGWRHPGLPEAVDAGMQQHTSEVIVKFQDVVNHDLSAIDRHVQKIADDMSRQFQQMMYETISAACDQTGNVVDAKVAGGPLEGLAAMLEKVQFSADKHGNVTPPQLHLSSEMLKKLREAEKSATPELLQRIQETRERKSAEAIQGEVRRKARFVRYGADA